MYAKNADTRNIFQSTCIKADLDVNQFKILIHSVIILLVGQLHTSCSILEMKPALFTLFFTVIVGHTFGYYVVSNISLEDNRFFFFLEKI